MRRNQVISKRKLISNIVGWPDYYISKRSRLYRYYPKRKVWMLLITPIKNWEKSIS